MTEIEKKALALVNEVSSWPIKAIASEAGHLDLYRALCRAIEQHDAYRQEVSDAVEAYWESEKPWPKAPSPVLLARFITTKPDPLVEALDDLKDGRAGQTTESYAACLRAALAKRGLEIKEVDHD